MGLFDMSTGSGMLFSGGLGALGQGLMGQQDQALGNLHLVNPAQQALYNTMTDRLLSGSGDFGTGQAIKQGKSQLQDFMAQRGISPDSGIYGQQMGNMVANAASQGAANRRNTMLQLMGTPLQTAQTAGANYITGSPSSGTTTEAQANSFRNKGQRKYHGYAWD
jgi:hypothetical protein